MTNVEKLSENSWRVTLAGRPYVATYDRNPDTFPGDRWHVVNSRGQVMAWDNPISRDVINAIRADTAPRRVSD